MKQHQVDLEPRQQLRLRTPCAVSPKVLRSARREQRRIGSSSPMCDVYHMAVAPVDAKVSHKVSDFQLVTSRHSLMPPGQHRGAIGTDHHAVLGQRAVICDFPACHAHETRLGDHARPQESRYPNSQSIEGEQTSRRGGL